jgi:hypothetical protein
MSGLRTFMPPVDIPSFSVIALWHPRLNADPAHRWIRDLLATVARELRASPAITPDG